MKKYKACIDCKHKDYFNCCGAVKIKEFTALRGTRLVEQPIRKARGIFGKCGKKARLFEPKGD